ncbi:hypothetical protein KIPB_012043, partial [Kipferlia bialata]
YRMSPPSPPPGTVSGKGHSRSKSSRHSQREREREREKETHVPKPHDPTLPMSCVPLPSPHPSILLRPVTVQEGVPYNRLASVVSEAPPAGILTSALGAITTVLLSLSDNKERPPSTSVPAHPPNPHHHVRLAETVVFVTEILSLALSCPLTSMPLFANNPNRAFRALIDASCIPLETEGEREGGREGEREGEREDPVTPLTLHRHPMSILATKVRLRVGAQRALATLLCCQYGQGEGETQGRQSRYC